MGLSQDAITGLYAHESTRLQRFLTRKLGTREDAEDVVQDAYLRMMSAPVQEPALRSPKAFLFTVASNLAVDSIRRQQRERSALEHMAGHDMIVQGEQFDLISPTRPPEQRVDDWGRLEDVLGSLKALPRKCRRAFFLHKFLDLSYAEVARHLGVTVSMVEKYLSQALCHVRSQPFATGLDG